MWKHLEVELDYLVRRATFCGWQIAPRRISNYELVYVLRGQGDICLGSRQFTVRTGDLVCFCPGVLHSLSVARQPCIELYGVHFTLPSGVDRLPLPEVAKIEAPGSLEPLFKSLFEIYKQKTYLYQWRQNLLLEQILCEILSALHGENAPAELIRIKKVLEHIHEDPARPFTLEDLTARSGVKKTLFLQSFRRMTGTTPKQYILGLRLEYARDLLLETDVPVAQVAERCGFSDSFYFSRCFKNHFSTSPRPYRKEHALIPISQFAHVFCQFQQRIFAIFFVF